MLRSAAQRPGQAADVAARPRHQRMYVSPREPEQSSAFHVISRPRFRLLGRGHEARVSVRVANRSDMNIEPEPAQETHCTQHEDVIDSRILTQQVCDPERASHAFLEL